jgi:hypothetical protein
VATVWITVAPYGRSWMPDTCINVQAAVVRVTSLHGVAGKLLILKGLN